MDAMSRFIERHSRTVHRLAPFWRSASAQKDAPTDTGDLDMTIVFAVVGEHRDNPNHLSVLGDDGQYYDYGLSTGQAALVDPDWSWKTDRVTPDLAWAFGA
jgi:hypothetical protein